MALRRIAGQLALSQYPELKAVGASQPPSRRKPTTTMPREQVGGLSAITPALQYALVTAATKLLTAGVEVFSVEAAAASLALDRCKGTALTKQDYCRLWGWSRQILKTRWDRVSAMADVFNGAVGTSSNHRSNHTATTSNHEQRESGARSQGSNHTATTSNHLTILEEESSYEDSSLRASPSNARETTATKTADAHLAVNPWDPHTCPPDLPTILETARLMAVFDEEAVLEFYARFGPRETGGTGWVDDVGPIANWNLRLRKFMTSWIDNRKREERTGSRKRIRERESTTTAETADAAPWWVWDYSTAAVHARKRGEPEYQTTWPAFRRDDGRIVFIAPDNISRGIPDNLVRFNG